MGVKYVMTPDIHAGAHDRPVDCFSTDSWVAGDVISCVMFRDKITGFSTARPVRHRAPALLTSPRTGHRLRCTGIEDPRAQRPWCSWLPAFLTGADPATRSRRRGGFLFDQIAQCRLHARVHAHQ